MRNTCKMLQFHSENIVHLTNTGHRCSMYIIYINMYVRLKLYEIKLLKVNTPT